MENSKKPARAGKVNVRKLALMGILAAVATVLMALKFPVFFAPSFYKLEFSDTVVLIGSYVLGPLAGVAIEAVKVLLNLAYDGTVTAGIGELSNFLMGCAFVVPASLLYRTRKTFRTALLGVAVGFVSAVVVAALLNYFVLIPAYVRVAGFPLSAIIGMGNAITPAITDLRSLILLATVPFNAVKYLACSIVAMPLYRRVARVLER